MKRRGFFGALLGLPAAAVALTKEISEEQLETQFCSKSDLTAQDYEISDDDWVTACTAVPAASEKFWQRIK